MSDPVDDRAAELALDLQHLTALTDQLAQTGVSDIEIAYENDEPPFSWWVKANYDGHRIYGEHPNRADIAAHEAATKAIHNGLCKTCGRTITFPHLRPGYCSRILVQAREGDAMVYKRLCDLVALGAGIEAAG